MIDIHDELLRCKDIIYVPGIIRVEWNRRFTRRIADAVYFPAQSKGRIRLSTKLFPLLSSDQQLDTIRHEYAHLVVHYRHGWNLPAHGDVWKRIARRVGATPEATLKDVPAAMRQFDRQQKRYEYYCPCGITHIFTANRVGRMKNGKGRICKQCRTLINPHQARELSQ